MKGLTVGVIGVLAAGAVVFAACSGDDSTSKATTAAATTAAATTAAASPSAAATPTAAATATPAVQTIEIKTLEAADKYTFDPAQVTVKAGKVTVHLTNPAGNARAHTFELKTADGSADIVKSDMVQAGGSLDVSFTVSDAGTYQFLCFQRGHADRGQVGTLTVTK